MSQYTTGNVTVTNGNATVIGASLDWVTGSAVKIGYLFKKNNENAFYEVSAVNTATRITLTTAYAGSNASNVDYQITRDFTTYLNLPEMTLGDLDFQDTYTRAVRLLDSVVASRLRKKYTIDTGSNRQNWAVGMTATSNKVKIANASAGADQVEAIGFIETDSDTSVTVVFTGPLPGFYGLTPGTKYYLASTNSATNITSTAPTTAGYIAQYLGVADTASSLIVNIRNASTL